MLILVPPTLLLLGALAIVITDKSKPKYSRSWLIAMTTTLVAWIIIGLFRLYLPTTVNLLDWKPEELFFASPKLSIDYLTWPYAMALITICLASILTDTARSQQESNPTSWAASMSITAIGLIALLAGNPLTMVMAWSLVDIVELVYFLTSQPKGKFTQRMISAFAVRLLSIVAFIWATMVGWMEVGSFDFTEMPSRAGIYFLIAAGLRLGVLPLNVPFFEEPELNKGSGTLLRLAPVASSLGVIAYLPIDALSIRPFWILPIRILTTLSILYASIMWASRDSETEARPYWIIALAGLAITSALNGMAAYSRAWGVALLLSGSLVFLFHPRIKRLRFLLLIGMLGIIALPYTAAASGWMGIIGQSFNFWSVMMILAHAILILGYIRYILTARSATTGLETWAKITFPLGFILIIQTTIALGIVGWPGVFTSELWLPSIVSLAIVCATVIAFWRLNISPYEIQFSENNKTITRIRAISHRIQEIFSFQWFYKLLLAGYRLLSQVFNTIISILEGEGGILWSIVLLILIITIMFSQAGG